MFKTVCVLSVITTLVSGQCPPPTDPPKPQCYALLDTDAPLRNMVGVLAANGINVDYDKLMTGMVGNVLGAMPTSVPTCLANFDGKQLMPVLAQMVKSNCMTFKYTLAESKEIGALMDNMPKGGPDMLAEIGGLFAFIKNAQPISYANLCTDLTSELAMCINGLAPVLFETIKAHSNGCCEPMFESALKNTGDDPATLMADVLGLVLDSICSTRSPGIHKEPASTCGYNMVQVFFKEDPMYTFMDVLDAMKIPSEVACDAMAGKAVTLTSGSNKTFAAVQVKGEALVTLDSCAKPVDSLITKFRDMPVFELLDVLADGTCYEYTKERWAAFKAWMIHSVGLSDTMAGFIASMARGNCFHFANGYTKDCSFESEMTSVVGPHGPEPKKPELPNPSAGRRDDLKDDMNGATSMLVSLLSLALPCALAITLLRYTK